jgi:hypothetical protein
VPAAYSVAARFSAAARMRGCKHTLSARKATGAARSPVGPDADARHSMSGTRNTSQQFGPPTPFANWACWTSCRANRCPQRVAPAGWDTDCDDHRTQASAPALQQRSWRHTWCRVCCKHGRTHPCDRIRDWIVAMGCMGNSSHAPRRVPHWYLEIQQGSPLAHSDTDGLVLVIAARCI